MSISTSAGRRAKNTSFTTYVNTWFSGENVPGKYIKAILVANNGASDRWMAINFDSVDYPSNGETPNAMIKRVMEFGASGKAKPMPYAQRLRLSMLTGAPLDRSLTQLAGYQQAFSSAHAQEQPKGGAGALKAPNLATDVQRVSA